MTAYRRIILLTQQETSTLIQTVTYSSSSSKLYRTLPIKAEQGNPRMIDTVISNSSTQRTQRVMTTCDIGLSLSELINLNRIKTVKSLSDNVLVDLASSSVLCQSANRAPTLSCQHHRCGSPMGASIDSYLVSCLGLMHSVPCQHHQSLSLHPCNQNHH